MKGVEVAVFFGRHAARVAATAKRFGASATTDLDRILDDETIDAIDLVVPSGSHRGLAIAALERGKHVFCETPLALTLEDADAMIRTARRSRRLLLCAQLMRFVPQYAHARGVAASGRLGRPVVGVASRLSRPYWTRKDPRPFATYGEPVVELSIFDFNFLNWVFGRPISVSASGLRGDRGAADYVLATVQYTRAIGLVEGSARMPQNYPLEHAHALSSSSKACSRPTSGSGRRVSHSRTWSSPDEERGKRCPSRGRTRTKRNASTSSRRSAARRTRP